MAVAVAIMMILISALSSPARSKSATGSNCYESIISFGDSLADTGNYPLICAPNARPPFAKPPYGETFFHYPSGRCSDGRLVIDFIAESLGLPLVQPYNGGGADGRSFRKGVNFAVIGATALDSEFYEKIGFHNPTSNVSLGTELIWFKQFLATIPDGRKHVEKSLVLMGEIGGNDYNYPIMQRASLEAIQPLIQLVVDNIGSTIEELINLGAKTLLVPGNLPIGCLPIYLTEYMATSNATDYDPKTGCLNWLNDLSIYHNDLLQKELDRIRQLYPEANVIYADYYNAAIRFYHSPNQFGFSRKNVLRACCGTGGKYNFNETAMCGVSPATPCDDPAAYANWDGIHFTEAFYRNIAQGLIQGPFTTPHISTICPSLTGISSRNSVLRVLINVW